MSASLDFETAFKDATERLRCKADPHSPEYNPDYEALVYILAIGNGRLKKVLDDVHQTNAQLRIAQCQ